MKNNYKEMMSTLIVLMKFSEIEKYSFVNLNYLTFLERIETCDQGPLSKTLETINASYERLLLSDICWFISTSIL